MLAGNRIRLGISADAAYSVDDFDLAAVDGASYTYAYNDANELTTMNLDGVETHFTYDDWGRTASKYVGDGSVLHAEYGYRYGDKLKQVFSTFPGEEDEVHFIHDGLGKRRMKQVHGETNPAMEREWYRYDAGWNVVGQYADDPASFWDIGGLEATAVWYGMTPLAEVTGSTPNGAYRHATHDHLGSTRSLFDASKTAIGAIEYTPYGLPLVTAGVTPEYTFTGKPFDPETGMYHFPYRQYSPTTGRWLTRDPLGMVDGPNLYGYVVHNPVNYWDLLGRQRERFPYCTIRDKKGRIIYSGYCTRDQQDDLDKCYSQFVLDLADCATTPSSVKDLCECEEEARCNYYKCVGGALGQDWDDVPCESIGDVKVGCGAAQDNGPLNSGDALCILLLLLALVSLRSKRKAFR
jgi:RHS repeat-associated protein